MKEVQIKGQAIRTTQQVIEELWGSSVARRVFDGLGDDFRTALDTGSIVTSGWYPISWYRQFHDLLGGLLPAESDFADRLGRVTMERDLSGIYRFILKLTSPNLLARHFDKVVSSYLRGGEFEVAVREKSFMVDAYGWYGMCSSLWRECASGCELILARTSAKSPRTSIVELTPGKARVEFSWT